MAFRTLGLEPNILKALQETGYSHPTPIQAAAIPPILAGKDLIGIAQTGTGKTAAFVLPILTRLIAAAPNSPHIGIRGLILAPTRELAAQISDNVRIYAKHLPLRFATIFGGVSERPQIDALRAGVDVVVATPGRLLDLMKQKHAHFSHLQFLVLDEADRMLDMGFLPDIRRIIKSLPLKRQTLLFSATLSKEIEAITNEFLRSPETVEIGSRAKPADTVAQSIFDVPKSHKQSLLLHLLRDSKLDSVLVFTRTKHGADRLARGLQRNGITTATLHSNRSQNQRIRALKDFKAGAVRVLVATDIAARGIDVDGISHVVNFDFPLHPEDYVHRIGRTGRAQQIGDAISFVTPEDLAPLRSLERFIGRKLERAIPEGFDLPPPPPQPEPGKPSPTQRSRPKTPRDFPVGHPPKNQPSQKQSRPRRPQGARSSSPQSPSVNTPSNPSSWSPRRK